MKIENEKIIKAFEIVKGKKIQDTDFNKYVGKDFRLDSIAVVDLWFEIKKVAIHKKSINDFFNYLRNSRAEDLGNDFTLDELKNFFNELS
jgi:hypothetical protein